MVQAGEHPPRAALEDRQPRDVLLNLRDDLRRRRPGPDHAHALAAQVVPVVPPRRVEHRPGEAVQTGHCGQLRLGEAAGGGHQHLRREGPAIGLHAPAARVLVPPRPCHLRAEPDQGLDPAVAGNVPEVVEDLGLRSEEAAPVRVQRERERVQVRRDVARTARVCVRPPRPAEPVVALEDHEVLVSSLAQPDRGADAAESRADDRDANVPEPALGTRLEHHARDRNPLGAGGRVSRATHLSGWVGAR